MMTGKDDDAASIREDSFLAELVPQAAEHLAGQHAGDYDAEDGRARFQSWLAGHTERPVSPAPGEELAHAGTVEEALPEHASGPRADMCFLTVTEAAVIMRMPKMNVYRLVQKGELEAIRVGRSFRVPEEAVIRYMRMANADALEATGRPRR